MLPNDLDLKKAYEVQQTEQLKSTNHAIGPPFVNWVYHKKMKRSFFNFEIWEYVNKCHCHIRVEKVQ